MVGLRFGKLVVESEGGRVGTRAKRAFNVVCDCGARKQVVGEQLRAGTSSCGCDKRPRGAPSLIGVRLHHLTVREERYEVGGRIVTAVCTCGSTVEVLRKLVTSGNRRHCGDAAKHPRQLGNRKHGGVGTATYITWRAMRQRCENPKAEKYPLYGGRGIRVCERWKTYANFLADMGERPEGMTLDRWPNTDGHYEPANCRWADAKTQASNRAPRGTRLIQPKE